MPCETGVLARPGIGVGLKLCDVVQVCGCAEVQCQCRSVRPFMRQVSRNWSDTYALELYV